MLIFIHNLIIDKCTFKSKIKNKNNYLNKCTTKDLNLFSKDQKTKM